MTNYTEKLTNYSNSNISKLPNFQENMTFNQSGQVGVQQFADIIGNAVGPTSFGSRGLTGFAMLTVISWTLYKGEASLDASAAVYIPAIFILGTYGFLPYGEGLIFGAILGIATLVTFGIARYLL